MSIDTRPTGTRMSAANAVGIALDNPDDPHVVVAVHGGRIVYIGISDPILNSIQTDLESVINGCILSAFAMWAAQMSGVIEL